MIKGLHVTIYTPQAEAVRAFMRDKLGLKFSDPGGGWLIFDVTDAEIGIHDMDDSDTTSKGGTYQEISFYCDDIHQTISELQGRGVEFTSEVVDEGWGLSAQFLMPGDINVMLFQPRYVKNSA